MSDPRSSQSPTPSSPEGSAAPFDLALSRFVDGLAASDDVSLIDSEEAARPGVWRQVAQAQRLNASLNTELIPMLARAANVIIPAAAPIVIPVNGRDSDSASHRFSRRTKLAAAWGGWAAAAAVALSTLAPVATPSNTATLERGSVASAPILSAAETLSDYLSKGKTDGTVIGELPRKVLVETTERADGAGFDVIYLRQIMERARVDDLYRFSSDELGNPTPVRVQSGKIGPDKGPL